MRALGPAYFAYPLHVTRTVAYMQRLHDAVAAANLRPAPVMPAGSRGGLNLNVGCAMASGGLAITVEQPAIKEWTFEEMLQTFYVVVETFLENGLKEPFSPREQIYREK
jgi:hypothetical protein